MQPCKTRLTFKTFDADAQAKVSVGSGRDWEGICCAAAGCITWACWAGHAIGHQPAGLSYPRWLGGTYTSNLNWVAKLTAMLAMILCSSGQYKVSKHSAVVSRQAERRVASSTRSY